MCNDVPKVSVAVIVKARDFKSNFPTQEAFDRFRIRSQEEVTHRKHGCLWGDTVYASTSLDETDPKRCVSGRFTGWELTLDGPVFHIEGNKTDFRQVFPVGGTK